MNEQEKLINDEFYWIKAKRGNYPFVGLAERINYGGMVGVKWRFLTCGNDEPIPLENVDVLEIIPRKMNNQNMIIVNCPDDGEEVELYQDENHSEHAPTGKCPKCGEYVLIVNHLSIGEEQKIITSKNWINL